MSYTDYRKPVQIMPYQSDHFFKKVQCGQNHCIAISSKGGIAYTWGSNTLGQQGRATTDNMGSPSPGQSAYSPKYDAIDVAAGGYNNIVFTSDNRIITWGINTYCSASLTKPILTMPTVVMNISHVFDIKASINHTFVLTESGLYACGLNDHGQFGNGRTNQDPQPLTQIKHINYTNGYRYVAVGSNKSIAIVEYDCKERSYCQGAQHGLCVSPNICHCEPGMYGGDSCQYLMCNGHVADGKDVVCSGHGACIAPNQCRCSKGFTDNDCQTPYSCWEYKATDSRVCGGHGLCIDTNKCECVSGYYGQDCTISVGGDRSTGYLVIIGSVVCGMALIAIVIAVILIIAKTRQNSVVPVAQNIDEEQEEIIIDKELLSKKMM
jgi:hypothetical protein